MDLLEKYQQMLKDENALPKCKVTFKGRQHKGFILETRMGKHKVQILDASGSQIKTDWFENNEIKRVWD